MSDVVYLSRYNRHHLFHVPLFSGGRAAFLAPKTSQRDPGFDSHFSHAMTSSPRLPPELCDHIIDQLRDQPNALRSCSVVSKSWTPRSRKHIFSTISFNNDSDVAAWWNTFPDPSNSPAYHARTLAVNYRRGFPETHLSSFCNVTHLCLHVHQVDGHPTSLAQLHG